ERRREGEMIFKADVLPAGLAVIAAVFGIGEKACDGMRAKRLEKRRPLDLLERRDLLRRAQLGELCATGAARSVFEQGQPLLVNRLLFAVKSGQHAVNE